jgi:hypothetical protein
MRGRASAARPGRSAGLVLGAGEAAKRLLAGIQHQGWVVLGLLDDDPPSRARALPVCRCWGR